MSKPLTMPDERCREKSVMAVPRGSRRPRRASPLAPNRALLTTPFGAGAAALAAALVGLAAGAAAGAAGGAKSPKGSTSTARGGGADGGSRRASWTREMNTMLSN